MAYASDVNDTDTSNALAQENVQPVEIDSNGSDTYTAPVDSNQQPSNADSRLVSKTIKSKNIKKYCNSKTPYKAKFLQMNGKPLANAKVKVNINSKTYTMTTNGKGIISIPIKLKPGNYKVVAFNPITGFKLTTSCKVLTTIKSNDLNKVFNDTKRFNVKFLKSNGKPLAKKVVKYKLKGKFFKVRTSKNGKISISLKKFKKGKYKITLYGVNGFKKTNTIRIVKSAKTKLKTPYRVFYKGSSKVVKVKLRDQFNFRLSSGYVVKAKINGKTYKSKTNAKGIATFKLKSLNRGIYTVTYKFAGKSCYKPSKATNKVVIISSKKPKFTVKSGTVFGHGAHSSFKVKLSAQKIHLAKKTIIFTVKGKKYKVLTDGRGIASLPIDLPVGNYKIKYSVKKDSLLNAKSASTRITVKERIPTYIFWKSGTNFYRGYQNCLILLKDKNNNPLKGKPIEVTVSSKVYKASTDSNGHASFNVILPGGSYEVSYKFGANGDNDYAPSKKSAMLDVKHKVSSGYGYWLKKEQFESVTMDDISSLASQGVSDIFLNSNTVSAFGKERIESWISNVSTFGIKVHFWVQVFKNNDIWTSPIVNGKVNTKFFNQRINDIKEYSKIKGISGIHLDYIRFPGNAYKYSGSTDAINSFIKKATLAVRNIDKELVLSCAIMAKTDKSKYYYAQDYSFISQYMDVVMPMIYKGNAGKSTSWITSTTQWYVEHSRGAKVWSGIQTYKSDDDITLLSMDAMNKDAKAAVNGGASGLILFRWGLTNYIDFNQVRS